MKEARHNDDGTLDEVVSDDVKFFHLEQMDEGAWWIGLDHNDGSFTHIWLRSNNQSKTKVHASCEMDGVFVEKEREE